MLSKVQEMAEKRMPPKLTPVAEVTRVDSAPRKDWDRIVEQQARRDAMSTQQPEQPAGSDSHAPKQTVFNDQNYTPRGADNVLSHREIYRPAEPEKPTEKVRVAIVKETRDTTCSILREGIIERRNCKA